MKGWKTVVWSDETNITRLGSDRKVRGWKKAGEGSSDRLVKETAKFGGVSLVKYWVRVLSVGIELKRTGGMSRKDWRLISMGSFDIGQGAHQLRTWWSQSSRDDVVLHSV